MLREFWLPIFGLVSLQLMLLGCEMKSVAVPASASQTVAISTSGSGFSEFITPHGAHCVLVKRYDGGPALAISCDHRGVDIYQIKKDSNVNN